MSDGTFVGPVDFAEWGGERGDVAGEEAPGGRVGCPAFGIIGEHGGSVVVRVDGDREKDKAAAELRAEVTLKGGEIGAEARADVGKRTAGVDEVDGDHFPAEAGGFDRAPQLVGELE